MASWVETHKPYETVSTADLRTGTVLKRIPFPAALLGASRFGIREADGATNEVSLSAADIGSKVARGDDVTILSAVVVTPDCDIFQHKSNAVTVAQVLDVESYVKANVTKEAAARQFRADVQSACGANPGAFNKAGLFLLPGNDELDFPDSLVLFGNYVSLPVVFASGDHGFAVSEACIGGLENAWFRIRHDLLRVRLVNEFARHLLRIGLPEA